MNKYNNFTVEETNLLSIYMTGSKEGLVVAMNAALPFMEGEMRDFAARTLAKVGRMTEAEFAGLALYPADEAYKKGVEMTMTQLKEVLTKLGIEEIPALGEPFDPNLHNAVMHVEDEGAGENTIVDVFQTGFKSGDKVVRFAMVKVAN